MGSIKFEAKPVRTRIAPSPTGFPHIGTVYQALFNLVLAKKHQGKFIIRIEDTDQSRKVDKAEEVIYEALEYFGLVPDEGPKYGGNYGPYRQSERLALYQEKAKQLVEQGNAYYCFCSQERLQQVRAKMQQEGQPPMYDKHCRSLDPEEAAKRAEIEGNVIRMKIPENETISFTDELRGEISFLSESVDDQVILKSDGFPTYHLAVVVDDHEMEITHIIRGEEWISSTPKHLLLYRYFDWPIPQIIHLPLLRNPDRSKISKRHGHTSAFWYREQGYLVEAVINFLASRVWNHPAGKEVFTLAELIEDFRFEDMHIQGPIVDLQKLNWLNGQWIRSLSDEELLDKLWLFKPEEMPDELLVKIIPLIRERLVNLGQLESLSYYFYRQPEVEAIQLTKLSRMEAKETGEYLTKVKTVVAGLEIFKADELEQALRELQEKLGLKPRPAFMTIRMAVTGEIATPPLFEVMEVLGKDEVVKRLTLAASDLKD